jgi:hypothetical protein
MFSADPLSLANHLEHLRGARALLNTPLVLFQRVIGVNQAQTAPSERRIIGLLESKHALFWATANAGVVVRPFVYLFIHREQTKGREREIPSHKCRALAFCVLRKAPLTMGSVLFCLRFAYECGRRD